MAWKAIEDLARGLLEAFEAAGNKLPIYVTGLGLATEATLAAIAGLLASGGQSVAALIAAIGAKLPAIGPQTAAASLSVTHPSDLGAERATGAIVSAAAAGDNVLIAGSGSTVVRVYRVLLVFGGATTAVIKSGSTALTGTMSFQQGGTMVLDFDDEPWFTGGAGQAIRLTLGSAVQVSGRIWYTQG